MEYVIWMVLTFPKEPWPSTLRSSNWDGSALSWPSRVTSFTSISDSTPFMGPSPFSPPSGVTAGLTRERREVEMFSFALSIDLLDSGDGCEEIKNVYSNVVVNNFGRIVLEINIWNIFQLTKSYENCSLLSRISIFLTHTVVWSNPYNIFPKVITVTVFFLGAFTGNLLVETSIDRTISPMSSFEFNNCTFGRRHMDI